MIDRPKSLGEAWRLLIQMEERIDELENKLSASLDTIIIATNTALEQSHKNTELQALVNREWDYSEWLDYGIEQRYKI